MLLKDSETVEHEQILLVKDFMKTLVVLKKLHMICMNLILLFRPIYLLQIDANKTEEREKVLIINKLFTN